MRIISGGQTGADQGGLDASIALEAQGLLPPHGGTCPRHRRSEDGRIPLKYNLQEHSSPQYPPRTAKNVADADVTLVLFRGKYGVGSKLTLDIAKRTGKNAMALDITYEDCLPLVAGIVYGAIHRAKKEGREAVINIAGPRESSDPGLQAAVKEFLIKALTTPFGYYPAVLSPAEPTGSVGKDSRNTGDPGSV